MAKSVSDLSAEPPLGAPTRRGHPDTRGHICHADHSLAEQEIHAVFPSPKLVPGKVSGFVAFLQGRFAEGWWAG